jgi:hypothetical protein
MQDTQWLQTLCFFVKFALFLDPSLLFLFNKNICSVLNLTEIAKPVKASETGLNPP